MKAGSEWRYGIAKRLFPVYAANPKVAAILVGGSTARGNNLMMLYQSFAEVQQRLLHVLLALNRVYYFGFKWLDVIAERLERKPPDLVERMAKVYEVEPVVGAAMLAELVEETYDLIEQQLPQLDVAWLRSVFRYKRPFWEEAPGGI